MARISIDPERELAELKEYLGDAYDHARLQRYEQAVDEELAEVGDEPTLYRTSQMYLYNLTAFAMSRTKEPYLADLTDLVPPGSRVLDYGCGIGSDGLLLLEAGYDVGFADFANPSTEYLRWRLRKRGLEAPIYDLDSAPPPPGWDAAYSFDVIEHVEDPFAFLASLERLATLVVVNFLEPLPDEPDVHHELPIRALLGHAATRRLRRYRLHHGRSHLVVYENRPGSRVLGRAKLASGRRRGQK
ncbi:MAG: mycofactocin glycosyltransferase [Thermoleophilaceae bacterium]|nr:mycofactocin glycosyltransferase [Thermoleophilaceae bacterium]